MKVEPFATQNFSSNRVRRVFPGLGRNRRLRPRIALRVQWLFFKRWWGETVSLRGLVAGVRRPTILLLIGLGLPLTMLWLFPFETWMKPVVRDGAVQLTDELAWKELIRPLLLFIGLPSAFVLWAFRDHNASAALQNQRKDINLKEFQEIQLRAAGALDEKFPASARQTLQVAAIHQLRPFLRGEYGASFRRPAWELLKALLATSAKESGYTAIKEWVERGGFPKLAGENEADKAKSTTNEISLAIDAIHPNTVAQATQTIVSEEAHRLFRCDLPLEGGHFDGIDLRKTLLARLEISRASFIAVDLSGAHLEGATLTDAHLEGAYLDGAHLEGAILSGAHLEGADLFSAHLEGAVLRGAHLEGTNFERGFLQGAFLSFSHLDDANFESAFLEGAVLSYAHLKGANLGDASLQGAKLIGTLIDDKTELSGARYNDDTEFASDWHSLSEAARDDARGPWRERGMRHVSELVRTERARTS